MSLDLESTRRNLHAFRDARGANSPQGHIASSIIELLPRLSEPRPPWALDERQTVQWQAKNLMKKLARLKAASH